MKPKFKPGDRVKMLKHADWCSDATGTIALPKSLAKVFAKKDEWDKKYYREMKNYKGQIIIMYYVDFDNPQKDYTEPDNNFSSATVYEDFLEKL